MRYMIIEHFRDGDAVPVYRRLRDSGRQVPEGLTYLDSWVTLDLGRCYQIMECDDHSVLEEWMSRWADLVRFDVVPVIPSAEAVARISARL